MDKIAVVKKIVKAYNQVNIKYGVGGSLLLYFYNIVSDYRDIDLIVADKDIKKAYSILKSLGQEVAVPDDQIYCTKEIHRFLISGVEVDIIASFCINNSQGKYIMKFIEPCVFYLLDDTRVPLTDLQEWAKAYSMIEKKKGKAELIIKYLNK